jgi:hypothetical protein
LYLFQTIKLILNEIIFTEVWSLTFIKSKGEQMKEEMVDPDNPASHLTSIGIFSG